MKNLFLLAVLLSVSNATLAQAPSGFDIMKSQYDQNLGYSDEKGLGKMVIRSPQGEETVREFEYQQLETKGDQGNKALIRIVKPANLSGTSLLTHQNSGRDDDQWIYMPSFKKTNRIVGNAKRGNFIGSDFSFEDLAPKALNDYDYTFVRDEPCDTTTCHVIDCVSKKKGTSYSKITAWVRADNAQNFKMDLYDDKGTLVKSTTFADYRQLAGKYWRPFAITMQNVAKNTSSTFVVESLNVTTGLNENHFTQSALER